MRTISVIIPALNEANRLPQLIRYLQSSPDSSMIEIIVVDGQSADGTLAALKDIPGIVTATASRGRAAQMNSGAALATGRILYFLHADTYPPPTFVRDIVASVDRGDLAGCYRIKFDFDHWFLDFNAWFTRFAYTAFRFGDQSLFVDKELFQRLGGFAPMHLMEDQEIIRRIKRTTRFTVVKKSIVTSARKYLKNGVFRLQLAFTFIFILYSLGFSQNSLDTMYRKLIREAR